MKMMTIRLDEKLHQELKVYCAINGISIVAYILSLIEKDRKERINVKKVF